MKSDRIYLWVAVLAVCASATVNAYELGTHARLTYKAYEQSVLSSDESLVMSLGIDGLVLSSPASPFGNVYLDIGGTNVPERKANAFEKTYMVERSDNSNPVIPPSVSDLSLAGWLMRGAIREDDYCTAFGVWVAPNPKDDQDPPRASWRVVNHFFDPVNNRPLTFFPAAAAELFSQATGESDFRSAPAWVLGTRSPFAQPVVRDTATHNHYTILDGREAMYRALTGKSKTGADVANTKEQRNRYWATTFRVLGNAVHLIQDMAQPQHTRNDPHSGVLGYGHTSVYEKYIEARAVGLDSFDIDGKKIKPVSLTPLLNAAFPIPRVTKYSELWSTSPGDDGAVGRGLADYSNRRFFTAGKNLGENEYRLPLNDVSSYSPESAKDLLPSRTRTQINFLVGGDDNIRMTTESAFDFFLGIRKTYSLNRYNYDDQAKLLIPRAVAYSAGLIDYFFRGRLEIEDAGFSDDGIVLRVKNAIDPVTQAYWKDEALLGGHMVVTLQYDLSDATVPGGKLTYYHTSSRVALLSPVLPGQSSNEVYDFKGKDFPVVAPEGATNVEYRLVYRGRLGQEADSVVVGLFKPVSGFLVTPNYAPADGLSGPGQPRLMYYTKGKWHLDKKTEVVAGNIDWKGWYIGDKPTKVLSWVGPPMRYLPAREFYVGRDQRTYSESAFSNVVYQNGEVFAIAPKDVLAAAVARDSSNVSWLIVVTAGHDDQGYVDVVYRRLYKKSDSTAGWEEIGNSSNLRDALGYTQAADIPWFFNGAGKQAQTMRRWWKNGVYWPGGLLKRLTLQLSDDLKSATFAVANYGDTGFVTSRTCSANYDQRGAGSAQRAANMQGEYAFAVDYKNDKFVLAKIRVEAQSAAGSTVTVVRNQENQDIVTGLTEQPSARHREYLVFETEGGDKTEIQTLADDSGYTINWRSGGSMPPIYEYQSTRDSKVNEVTYFFDLRPDLYGYYFYSFRSTTQIANGIERNIEDGDEGSILSEGALSRTLHAGTFPHYDNTRPAVSRGNEIHCSSFDNGTYKSYGTANFGWWSHYGNAVGSIAKDTQGRAAHSQRILADFGYDVVGTSNTLSDGGFESVIPTVPESGAVYHPIRVVR
jgi:hypothetical protein